jgi:hypothetical protein
MKKYIVLAAGVLSVCSPVHAQPVETGQPKPRTVTVRGMGVVMTIPDQVRLSIQVNTRAESATAAMTEASTRTREILDILKSYGIDTKDIQTSRVTVSAILDYEKRLVPPPIIGYNGTNDFSVVFRGKQMESIGGFLDRGVAAGASSFGGLTYESSKQRELEREALRKAAADAQARASVLARELDASIVRVLSVSESLAAPGPLRREALSVESAVAAPVLAGELAIAVYVDAVFELK